VSELRPARDSTGEVTWHTSGTAAGKDDPAIEFLQDTVASKNKQETVLSRVAGFKGYWCLIINFSSVRFRLQITRLQIATLQIATLQIATLQIATLQIATLNHQQQSNITAEHAPPKLTARVRFPIGSYTEDL